MMESRWPCTLLDNLGLEKEEVRTSDGGRYPEADSAGEAAVTQQTTDLSFLRREEVVFPPGGRLDVQSVNSCSHSPVRNNWSGHSFHAHDRCEMLFPGIYHLRGECHRHHVLQDHLDDICPHHGNRSKGSATVKDLTALVAVVLRRISFLFTLLNATGPMMLSSFRFPSFLRTAPPTRRTGNLPTACL